MGFLKNIFSGSSYFMLNKVILKEIGLDEAIILSCLIEAGELFENEWFYQTVETIEDLTTITEYRQNKALKNLENMGILDKKLMGLPAKRHFRINIEKIMDILSNKLPKNLGNCNTKNLGNLDQKNYGTYTQNFMDNKEITYKEIKDKEISINKDIFSDINNFDIGKDLKQKLFEFVDFRKEIKKPFKSIRSIKQLIGSIGKTFIDESDLMECIDNSIMNGYQGVFPNKSKKTEVKKKSFARRELERLEKLERGV
ncbi:MAG: hypothetical protein ACRCX2_26325 [Paraclostridium sp.]